MESTIKRKNMFEILAQVASLLSILLDDILQSFALLGCNMRSAIKTSNRS